VHETYRQRKLREYQELMLASFGGHLGEQPAKPKLSKIEQEKIEFKNKREQKATEKEQRDEQKTT
jgi:hypothetical protein